METSRFAVGVAVAMVLGGCGAPSCPRGFERVGRACVLASDSGVVGDGGDPATDGCVDRTFYEDDDGDGAGRGESTRESCEAPDGFAAVSGDCDDADATVRSGAAERCNEIDDDCDGTVDEGATPATYYLDGDGDGFGVATTTASGCGAPSGFAAMAGDCDDARADVTPGADEICDGLDNDCDAPAAADETFACVRGATVSCTTSCGSIGSGACSDTCGTPTTCNAPDETCNDADDDCDGRIDESQQRLSPRRDAGSATGRVVALVRAGGFVSVSSRETGLYALLHDADGVPGAEVRVTPYVTDYFDAWVDSGNLVVAWVGAGVISAAVFDTTTLAAGPRRDIVPGVGDFTSRIAIVAAGGSLFVAYHNGTAILGASRAFPALTGTAAPVTIGSGGRADLDMAIDPVGPRAVIAYVDASDDIRLSSYTLAGSLVRTLAITSTTVPQRNPRPVFAELSSGERRIGVAYRSDEAVDRDRLSLVDVDTDGTMSTLDTVDVWTGTPPTATIDGPIDLGFAADRWFVPYLRVSSGTTSTWAYGIAHERADGAPVVGSATIESTAQENRSVGVAGDAAGGVFFVASRASGGIGRGYALGCY